MEDIWFGQDTTPTDYEACLQALSIAHKQMPLFAIVSGDGAAHLIFASQALFEFFGVFTADALSACLLSGRDPGARRLRSVCQDLPLESAPRLERLRFFIGPGTELLTLLCRRIVSGDRQLFVAAILGMRAGSVSMDAQNASTPAPQTSSTAETLGFVEPQLGEKPQTGLAGPMTVQTIQAMLRTRWPSSRTLRFTWQTDADMICSQVTQTLAEIVGSPNADLVGRDMMELAALIDPSGRFGSALARKETWSGLQVHWPIADAPAAVAVGLGAIPIRSRDGGFEGYRGYGVVDRESAIAAAPVRFASHEGMHRREDDNLLAFPNGRKELSVEDRETFVTLGEELREEVGFEDAGAFASSPDEKKLSARSDLASAIDAYQGDDLRARDIARHGLSLLDKLDVGLLVARANVPIFANRHLLDGLGFRDEDALHDAGGVSYLFDSQPEDSTIDRAIQLHGSEGRVISCRARVQTIEWDSLPATLFTIHFAPLGSEAIADRDVEVTELRAILETATDGVAVIDDSYNIHSLNRSGEALFGSKSTTH